MTEIEAVDALDFRLSADVWDFARERAPEIAAHWEKRRAEQPRLFNGRVLMLGRHAIEGRVLKGEFIETDFADFLAWREFGFPAANACNGFAMAALRGRDGAFLLGEMSPHTASAGAIYFPAGTPDRQDLAGDVVDLDASAKRELFEETGLRPEEAEIAPGWIVARVRGRVACMKPMRLAVTAEAAKARIDAALAADPQPEFSRMHVVRGEADFADAMPAFVRDYMAYVLAAERG
ncbi:MAG: NUDIX domain-containing protein [Pseudomonadota bacterium]|nr:NUDIX domain-containing protein [Pseudomonadota bacterium]